MKRKVLTLVMFIALSVSTTGCALLGANKEQLKDFAAETALKTGEKLAASIEKKLQEQAPVNNRPQTPKELLAIVGLYAIAEGRKWLRDRALKKTKLVPEPEGLKNPVESPVS